MTSACSSWLDCSRRFASAIAWSRVTWGIGGRFNHRGHRGHRASHKKLRGNRVKRGTVLQAIWTGVELKTELFSSLDSGTALDGSTIATRLFEPTELPRLNL